MSSRRQTTPDLLGQTPKADEAARIEPQPLPAGRMLAHRVRAVTALAQSLGAGAAVLGGSSAVRWLGVVDPPGLVAVLSEGEGIAIPPTELDAVLHQLGVCPEVPVATDVPRDLLSRPVVEATAPLAALRMRKEPFELELMTRAARVAQAGHEAARSSLAEGLSEMALVDVIDEAVRDAAGDPVHTAMELMAGSRTTLVDAPPAAASAVARGAPVLLDLAVRVNGYWTDTAATFCLGPSSAALRRRHAAVLAALEAGLAVVRPGAGVADVDAAMRDELARTGLSCPHRMGHGVGTAAAEPPWLAPDQDEVLDEDMVIALQPGAYSDGVGVRHEVVVMVGPRGPTALTTHPLGLTA